MNKEFDLLKLLNSPEPSAQQLPPNTKYRQYEVTVENKKYSVLVPLREVNEFEEQFEKIDFLYEFKRLLRDVRGIVE